MSGFFAMLSRMKYINRWGLMNNTRYENIAEHSLEVAMLAHALVTIANERFGQELSADRAAVLGIYHDASEIITGDMPTPVKYYNPSIKTAYKAVEAVAQDKLLSMLPKDLQRVYDDVLHERDAALMPYVKAADKLSALIKCIEEVRMGNNEFNLAKSSCEQALLGMDLPALSVFMDEYLPSYYLTLDELG